jgi:O-succinylbenzoate synthase
VSGDEDFVLTGIELRRVSMRLVAPFRAAHGTEWERDILLVRAVSDAGEGWGECAAQREPTYTAEYVDAAARVVRDYLAPRVLTSGLAAMDEVKGHPMAKAAIELAVLDAELRAAGRSFREFLGGSRAMVDAGVALGIAESVAELADQAEAAVAQGYRRVKLKIEPGWDVGPVNAVRERLRESAALQVDGNGAYRVEDAAPGGPLAALDSLGLQLIEQPLPADDLLGSAEVARRLRTPVCLDESIVSAQSAAVAIRLGACSIVNIKAGRVGGYREAVRVHDVCVAAGVPVWCGGMLETGLGRAANAALAALPGFSLPGDLAASDHYYAEDLTEPFVLEAGGRLRVPDGPGIGRTPRPDVLAARTTAAEFVTR